MILQILYDGELLTQVEIGNTVILERLSFAAILPSRMNKKGFVLPEYKYETAIPEEKPPTIKVIKAKRVLPNMQKANVAGPRKVLIRDDVKLKHHQVKEPTLTDRAKGVYSNEKSYD